MTSNIAYGRFALASDSVLRVDIIVIPKCDSFRASASINTDISCNES